MNNHLIEILKEKTNFSSKVISNIIKLLDEGCTIPFIARYRKDFTDGATDEQLRIFEEVYEYSKKLLVRKEEIIALLKEKNFLDEKVLKNLESATTLQACEDIYDTYLYDMCQASQYDVCEFEFEPNNLRTKWKTICC